MSRWQKILVTTGVMIVVTAGSVIGLTTQSANASVNDFYFDKMEVDYYLSKNADGQSELRVKEVLYPIFPDYDQNRGIVRSIPLTYQKHTLDLQVGQILRDDQPAPVYKNETSSGFRVLTIRDKSDSAYLHGSHKYEFNYTMRDVTMKPTDSAKQEFYWDTNGTGWSQQFQQIIARVHLDESVRQDFNPKQIACYTGVLNSTERDCYYEVNNDNSVVTFTTTKPLEAGGNMTLAIQFGEATFAAYKLSNYHRMLAWLVVILGSISAVLIIVVRIDKKKMRRQNQLAIIPTEYLPPADIDVFQSTVLYENLATYSAKIMPAGLIELAITRKIKIIERKAKSLFSRDKDYVIKVLPGRTWTEREEKFFSAIFKSKPVDDQEFKLDRDDYNMSSRVSSFTGKTVDSLRGDIYDVQATKRIIRPVIIKAIIAIVASGISFIVLLTALESVSVDNMDGILANAFIPFSSSIIHFFMINVSIISLASVFTFKQLTPAGVKANTHLRGLERYISMAEAERLAFNQSVGGAMRDAQGLVVLYERLLPYAIMFGLEASWSRALNAVYREANYTPSWYFGTQAFNANSFSNSIRSFRSVASSASSSSSSGSGGGGSSGG
ncbi:MAG: DUF2207 domain-containing protein, partial [Candidatus Saccharibacteria bacterium]|nr:DUF2207 domain-containing protein [Candidatus Saccharibacteria bacterium]